MKKLIMAAAVAVVSIAANAASINWTITNIYQPGSTADKIATGNGLVYIFCAQDVASSAVIAALSDTTTTLAEKSTFMSGNSIGSSALTGDGRVATSTAWTKTAGDYTFYGVILADNALAENGKYAVSTVTASYGWDNSSDTGVSLGNQKTLTQTASNWATVATSGSSPIPEPTSGLLLVLGVAGLALRRRRA